MSGATVQEDALGSAEPKATSGTLRETLAVLMLTGGSVLLPVLGWMAGLALVLTSRRYTAREKAGACLVLPGGLLTGVLIGAWFAGLTRFTCSSGVSTTTQGLGGPVVPGSVITSGPTCTHSILPGWIGLALSLCVVALSVAGPIWAWSRMRRREVPRSTSS